MRLLAACTLVGLGLLAPLHAQGGGFTAGDLYLFSPAIQGVSSTAGALVHVDLSAGTATILVDTVTTPSTMGLMCFDPWRQRLVFRAGIGTVSDPTHLWAADAAGNLDDLGFAGQNCSMFTPAGDGRIYVRNNTGTAPTQPLMYLDAAGDLNVLLDAAGAAPFLVDGNGFFDIRGLHYDAATNSLFVSSIAAVGACSGGATDKLNIRKLPLSADGTRVVGPVACIQFEAGSFENPANWSSGPGGLPLVVVDTNSNAQEPRLVLVDPSGPSASAFASNGSYVGAAATNAGTWCSALEKVVVLDTGIDVLRAFAAGETGPGTVLSIAGTVSEGAGSGEVATMHEVPPSACAGGWGPYGAGLAGAGGFVPRLLAAGCPGIGGAFTLSVDRGVGGATGSLFVGLAPAAVPFKGGTFLVGGVVLQVQLALGGASGVAGAGSVTLPAGLPPDPALQGVKLYLQVGLSDAAAVKDVSLTKGLRMEIG